MGSLNDPGYGDYGVTSYAVNFQAFGDVQNDRKNYRKLASVTDTDAPKFADPSTSAPEFTFNIDLK